MNLNHHNIARNQLDKLFFLDSILSLSFGMFSLLSPHGMLAWINGGGYNHDTHELLRLYGCLRIALGWTLFHVRNLDDGRFRRSICEALCILYFLQSLVVCRAIFTDQGSSSSSSNWINVVAIVWFVIQGGLYGRFRYGKNGDLIKVYELPTASLRTY
mmetsp:Transcript_22063/g.31014  ORF Transcript_22063/g.31014 Transcript_22063/m.31014 type:complete len:158 (+) Transcript_22063:332-805(+)